MKKNFIFFNFFSKEISTNSIEEKEKGYPIEVKNLPTSMNWQNLKDAFSVFGNIVSADLENRNNVHKNLKIF